MHSNGTIFLATKAVFDENAFPCCPEGNRANIPAIESGIHPYDETSPQEDYDYRGPDDHYPPENDDDDVWQSIGNIFPPFSGGGNQPPQNPQQPNPQGSQPNVGSGNQPSQAPGLIVAGPPPILGPGPMMVDPQANQPLGPTAASGPVANQPVAGQSNQPAGPSNPAGQQTPQHQNIGRPFGWMFGDPPGNLKQVHLNLGDRDNPVSHTAYPITFTIMCMGGFRL